jgi:uncharacterized membrane protein
MVPPRPTDRGHKVRVAFGNGLRADIWLDFKKRFGWLLRGLEGWMVPDVVESLRAPGIEEIQEFYGSLP